MYSISKYLNIFRHHYSGEHKPWAVGTSETYVTIIIEPGRQEGKNHIPFIIILRA